MAGAFQDGPLPCGMIEPDLSAPMQAFLPLKAYDQLTSSRKYPGRLPQTAVKRSEGDASSRILATGCPTGTSSGRGGAMLFARKGKALIPVSVASSNVIPEEG